MINYVTKYNCNKLLRISVYYNFIWNAKTYVANVSNIELINIIQYPIYSLVELILLRVA
jgi:hypothetical protein